MSSIERLGTHKQASNESVSGAQCVLTQNELLKLIDDVKNATMLDLAEHFKERPGRTYSSEDLVKLCVRQLVFSQGNTSH